MRSSLTSLLKRGEPIPGFGEAVPGFGPAYYPASNPRGKLLLELIARAYPQNPTVLLAQRITEETSTLLDDHPTAFFGLVTLARTLQLPPRARGHRSHACCAAPHGGTVQQRIVGMALVTVH